MPGVIPSTEETLIILPPPCSFITRATAWLRKNSPFRLRFIMESQARSLISSAGSMTGLVPALFTRISIRPNSALTRSTRLFISSSRPTCAATARDFLPSPFISSATFSRSGSFRLAITTSAPARASPRAAAFPIPRLPPVTRATLPSREKSISTS
ncbi:MAG: hypothetical protein DDT25_01284 [Chloroflexi bacterium]|nr:hypothetical protein [Chloroflexota bacterium]